VLGLAANRAGGSPALSDMVSAYATTLAAQGRACTALDFLEMVSDRSLVAEIQAFYAADFSLFNYSTDPWASFRGQVTAGLLPQPALQAEGEARLGSITCVAEQS